MKQKRSPNEALKDVSRPFQRLSKALVKALKGSLSRRLLGESPGSLFEQEFQGRGLEFLAEKSESR